MPVNTRYTVERKVEVLRIEAGEDVSRVQLVATPDVGGLTISVSGEAASFEEAEAIALTILRREIIGQ